MKRVFAAVLVWLMLAACSPIALTPTAEPATAPNSDTAQSSLLADVLSAGADRPAWQSTTLTNAESGATFTLADFPEKTVFVELIATGCSECRDQQAQVRAARAQLDGEQYVFISLSGEPSDTAAALADYKSRENLPWVFALAPAGMVSALVEQFGQTVIDLSATPHFVISPSGAISPLMTGTRTSDQLIAELTTAAGA